MKLTYIVFGLLFFGCNPTGSKNSSETDEKPADSRILQEEEFDDSEQLEANKIDSINEVIALFKTGNIDGISEKINFPLYREYPLPAIKDKEEFKQRFNEVFDKILIDKISDSKIEQWSEVGWRGIMLDDGVLWMANSDGIITSVNYQSDFEKKRRKDLIAAEKENLHISLKNFENPVYKIKTKNYLIRIDELANHKYRYASWKINEQESSKPDIILNNGESDFQGSAGNHVITFLNGTYTYKVYRNIIRAENDSEVSIEIEKDEKLILAEGGTLVVE